MKRTFTIDNGGSQIRYIGGVGNRTVEELEKKISYDDSNNFRVKDNVGKYDVIHILSAPSAEYEHRYYIGNGYMLYNGCDVLMSNRDKKSTSVEWFQQVILAMAIDAMKFKLSNIKTATLSNFPAVEKDTDEKDDGFEGVVDTIVKSSRTFTPRTSDVEINYDFATVIPIQEHSGNNDYASLIRENLSGTYEVSFPAMSDEPVNTVRFTIDKENIYVLPEGGIVVSLCKDIRKNDYTLLIDMGANSTEYAIYDGRTLIGKTVTSSYNAGSTLLSTIESSLRESAIECTPHTAITALTTHKAKVGSTEVNVSDEVKNSKRLFVSNYVARDIRSVLNLAGIQPQSIQNIVPIGGVLGVRNPDNNELDTLNMIIQQCGLVQASVLYMSENLRTVNITSAATFIDAVLAKK